MLGWVAMLLAAQGTAAAQPAASERSTEQARSHFDEGVRLYDRGRFDEAAARFEAAYDLTHEPELLYNVYVAHRDAAHDAEAAAALRSYLESGVRVQNRELLEQRLRALEDRIAAQRAAGEGRPEAVQAEPTPPDPDEHGPPILPWVLAGVGAGAALGALVLGIEARATHADLELACPMATCPPDRAGDLDTLRTQTFAADVLGVAAMAALATAIVLFVTALD